MLGPLQNNGGPTLTYALLPGSPAIDAGDPNFTPPPDYDQRGPGFVRVFNGRIDVGSFEVQPTDLFAYSTVTSMSARLRCNQPRPQRLLQRHRERQLLLPRRPRHQLPRLHQHQGLLQHRGLALRRHSADNFLASIAASANHNSSSKNAVSFFFACTAKRFPSSRCASAIQIAFPLQLIVKRSPNSNRLC